MERELPRLRELFAAGVNITAHLNERYGSSRERAQIIEYAYDLQAGAYVTALEDPGLLEKKRQWGAKVADLLGELEVRTVCDAGTGECTTLAFIMEALTRSTRVAAFDLSVSRTLVGRQFLAGRGLELDALFVAELGSIPFVDGACDLIMTHHSIEPNHGREEEIVRELARVTRRYLLMIEPSWELATPAQRERMQKHGYVRGLPAILERAGLRIVRQEAWPHDLNPENPAALLLAERAPGDQVGQDFGWASPVSGLSLRLVDEGLYCDGDGFLFPSIAGIPVLRREGAVLATRYGGLFPAST